MREKQHDLARLQPKQELDTRVTETENPPFLRVQQRARHLYDSGDFGDCFSVFPLSGCSNCHASFDIRLVDFWSENSTVRVRVLNLFIYISTYLFRKGILFLFVLFLWRLKFNGFVFP